MSDRKFLVLFRRAPPSSQQPEPSAEDMQKMYAVFNTWKEKYKREILDMGSALKPGGKVWRHSGVTDGPFVEAKEIVVGYMIVQAKDYDAAVRVAAEGPPGMAPDGALEIRELAAH
ncbi:MAG: hypothetical protein HY904_13035 [Deltaproteobacteria bacterium]|nr:hypothetical protein [Deltaproteobacteria bacterium]